MKNANTAAAHAMEILAPHMKNGRILESTAAALLREHNACTVRTLNRAGLLLCWDEYMMTPERHAAELEKLRKAEKVKALRAEIKRLNAEAARLTAELEALRKG